MGIREDIQTELTSEMASTGEFFDVVSNFSFIVKTGQTSYDVDADEYHDLTVESACKGIFANISERLVDDLNFKRDDQLCTVNAIDVETGVIPVKNMEIVLTDGTKFLIIDTGKVPGGDSLPIVYKMHLRRNG